MKDPNCPFCNTTHDLSKNFLEESGNFYIVTDEHPLMAGHIIIIPKEHISCVGEYPEGLFAEFLPIYEKVRKFVKDEYGAVSTFEHGKIGQSVFHSHTHILPFNGKPEQIIEDRSKIKPIKNLSELQSMFRDDGQYLFFSIEDQSWLVDTQLGFPRFFRDKFGIAVGRPERANWKEMHENQELMSEANKENDQLLNKWKSYFREQ